MMASVAWLIFVVAGALEVAGDAVIRKGLRGGGLAIIAAGMVMLGCYGLVVNRVPWDFSKLLGVYVGVFATLSVLCGRFAFGETVRPSTWLGLVIIVAGGLVIQFGSPTR
jgi:small multidrug resistance family-3 protein